jgi:hypothetical protein
MQLHLPYSTLRRCVLAIAISLMALPADAQTIPADRRTDWTKAGLQDTVPLYTTVVDIMNHGGDNTGTTANDAALQTAITALNGKAGIIYFPTGTYKFNQTVAMRDSLVLKGNGSGSKLIFDLGHNLTNMFNFHGSTNSTTWDVTQALAKDDNTIALNNTTGLQAGDWVQLYGNDVALTTSAWAYGTVGQILQVKSVAGNTITTVQQLRRGYDIAFTAKLKPITPIKGAGMECMYIQRLDSTIQQTNNIDFDMAVNCWVIGIESDSTNFCHVAMTNSAHLLARGNYFHHSHAYGGNGQGYGVAIQYTSGDCLVENNKFEHLRHSMLVQAGANGNVFAYNYSKDPYWDEPPFPTNSAGDIVCHGNYPYMNLFEGNIIQNIVIDNSHGINGPFNTLFRNRAQNYGIFMNSAPVTDSMNYVGNEVTSNSGFYSLQGLGHLEHGNNIKGTITPSGTTALPEVSLAFAQPPGYINLLGPWITIGTPFTYNSGTIPAASQTTDCRRNPVRLGDYVQPLNGTMTQLACHPNPANSIVSFKYDTPNGKKLSISICDMTGRQVALLPLHTATGIAHWDAATAPAGMYIYRLQDGDTLLQTGKLVVTQ